ncbi:hypothetical protein KBD34_02655 [Patescibacteria group bacterium]|nr:hypothetical protein [Patescibacteria group bacterium]
MGKSSIGLKIAGCGVTIQRIRKHPFPDWFNPEAELRRAIGAAPTDWKENFLSLAHGMWHAKRAVHYSLNGSLTGTFYAMPNDVPEDLLYWLLGYAWITRQWQDLVTALKKHPSAARRSILQRTAMFSFLQADRNGSILKLELQTR